MEGIGLVTGKARYLCDGFDRDASHLLVPVIPIFWCQSHRPGRSAKILYTQPFFESSSWQSSSTGSVTVVVLW